jgi:hypothetical protein
MKSAPDQTAIDSAPDKRDYIGVCYSLADEIKARIQAGEVVAATDYPESDRPLFWSAIARVRDELPAVKPTWRTIGEHHVDGIRTRQRLFKICSRERGILDPTLAAIVLLAAVAAALLIGGPL